MANGVDLSEGNYTSDPVEMRRFSLYAIQFKWTGFTGSCNILIQATNDLPSINDRIWTTVDTYGNVWYCV